MGGKGQLLPQLRLRVPSEFDRYYEPFLGGGALFFDRLPERAFFSDVNQEIIDCYLAVQRHVEELIEALKFHHYDSKHYYAVRDTDPRTLPLVERAARTIFLNKTGYNGLYRVNRSGKFNVPFGRYANPRICDEQNLRACSLALAHADIAVRDFADAVRDARRGDFVYFDPPYVPMSRTATFTAYAAGGFGPEEQRRLSGVFGQLSARSVSVVLSNSYVPEVRKLYSEYSIKVVKAARAVNSKATRRGRL